MSCLEFGRHDDDQECPAELEPVTEYSPGVVLDEERLARLVFTPIHVDEETGEVNAAAFNDVKDKGLSINRLEHITKSGLVQKGYEKAAADKAIGKKREFLGVIETLCSSVRSIYTANQRAFCVVDTALIHDSSHADVCQVPTGKQESRKARRALMREFSSNPVDLGNYN